MLIMLPLRLGLDQLNEDYAPVLKETFRIPQSVGISGGKPRASLYFVGNQGIVCPRAVCAVCAVCAMCAVFYSRVSCWCGRRLCVLFGSAHGAAGPPISRSRGRARLGGRLRHLPLLRAASAAHSVPFALHETTLARTHVVCQTKFGFWLMFFSLDVQGYRSVALPGVLLSQQGRL
jgi:hypothetical protein